MTFSHFGGTGQTEFQTLQDWLLFDHSAIYLVVVNMAETADSRRRSIEHWLRLISSRFPDSLDREYLPLILIVATHADLAVDEDAVSLNGQTWLSPWLSREIFSLRASFAGRLDIHGYNVVSSKDPSSLAMEDLRMALRRCRDSWMTQRSGVPGCAVGALHHLSVIRSRLSGITTCKLFEDALPIPPAAQACVSYNLAEMTLW